MRLGEYLAIIDRWKWLVVITVLVTAASMAVMSRLRASTYYEAVSVLRLSTPLRGSPDYWERDIAYADRLMNTFRDFGLSPASIDKVKQELKLPVAPDVAINVLPNSELMEIRARYSNAPAAANAAAAMATLLLSFSQQLELETNSSLAFSTLIPATIPAGPAGPDLWQLLLLGAVLGLMGGVGLALIVNNLDTRLHTGEQIERWAQAPVLGVIPNAKLGRRNLVYYSTTSEQMREAFDRLQAVIGNLVQRGGVQTLLVTSAERKTGKSFVAANLACAMALSGREVVLVDGDLRHPSLHELFELPSEPGLRTLLQQQLPVEQALQATDLSGLRVMTAGGASASHLDAESAKGMACLLSTLARGAEIVIIDASALLDAAYAVNLAKLTDGVILIVEYERSTQELVGTAQEQLRVVDAKLLGTVVNRTTRMLYNCRNVTVS